MYPPIDTLASQSYIRQINTIKAKYQVDKAETASNNEYNKIITSILVGTMALVTLFVLLAILLKRQREKVKLSTQKLATSRINAENAMRAKSVFLSNMSHEIRTPLNAIVGFSQLLSNPDLPLEDEEKLEFSSLVQHNSELLTTLVNDILDLSALESGKYTMNLTSCHCNEMCRLILSTIMDRKAEGVKLYYTSEVADDFQITTDEQRLQQVLINFLTNAEKHTEKGEIHLHCSVTEYPDRITFSVSDPGPGIPADKMDSVFERFKKLDEFKQGSGLGLNICRTIAERLHGEVKVDKSYTNGARFLLILPLK